MQLQVKQIVLWPRRAGFPPRVVDFALGTVNVITGISKTGKSAIIPIIDYCLGADKCSIPVNTIRDACGWFGVVFETAHGELLLARREPESQRATGDMFVVQGATVAIPDRVKGPNANVDSVKRTLDELAGLTQLDFDAEGSGLSYKGRPSFRDMTAFMFQPQNIVANPNILFYKSDTTEHREKLKTLLPYVLGAVTHEALALEHERQRLRIELRRKERELETIRDISLRWLAEIRARALRAYEFGLLPSPPSENASVSDLISSLRTAAAPAGMVGREPQLRAEAIRNAAQELVALQNEEAGISSRLSQLKQRFADMTRFREATEEFRGSLSIRRDRLQVADWIGNLFDSQHECPLCGAENPAAGPAVQSLRIALRRVEEQAGSMAQIPAAFDREYQRVREDLDLETERLNAVRIRRRALETTSEEARERQYQLVEAARFAGGLEEAITRYDNLRTDSDLVTEVAALRSRLGAIDARLRELDVRAETARAIQRFAAFIAQVLPQLDTERPNDPVELVIGELTLRIAGQGRDDYLWEIGSGANWLAYHIATSVALHQLFRSLPYNHVPTFAVYDQPSQVYFPRIDEHAGIEAGNSDSDETKPTKAVPPERHATDVGDDLSGENTGSSKRGVAVSSPHYRDEDVIAVRKIFRVLAGLAKESRGEWQAIVLDHADQDIWGDVEGVRLVEDWHGTASLVPVEWLA